MTDRINKVAQLPWVPWYPAIYARDTGQLNALEHGAYRLLLDHYYLTGRWPPDDDSQLWRIARCDSPEQWLAVRPRIVFYFKIRNGEWQHDRAESTARYALQKLEKYARNGRKGGLEKSRRTNGLPSEASSNASSNASSIEIKKEIPEEESDYSLPITSTESGTTAGAHSQKRTRRGQAADRPDLFTPKPKEPAHAQGRRLAEDWQPTPAERDFAADLGLDPQATSEHFADYWHQTAGARGRKVDWTATWRIWCRREVQDRRPGGPARPGAVRPARGGGLTSAFVDLAAHLEAKRRGGA